MPNRSRGIFAPAAGNANGRAAQAVSGKSSIGSFCPPWRVRGGAAALSLYTLSFIILFIFLFLLLLFTCDRYRSLAIADFRWQARHFRPEGSFPAAPRAKVPLIQENDPSALSVRLGGCAAEPEGDFFLSTLSFLYILFIFIFLFLFLLLGFFRF